MGSPFSGGIKAPAPRRQCWMMVRLCRTSSLKNTKPTYMNWKKYKNALQRQTEFFFLTYSCPVLPEQISEGAEVQAGESGPVNKKQRRSLPRWERATGYPSSRGLQADPSPAWNNTKHNILNILYISLVKMPESQAAFAPTDKTEPICFLRAQLVYSLSMCKQGK